MDASDPHIRDVLPAAAVQRSPPTYCPEPLTRAQVDAALPRLRELIAAAEPKVAEDVKRIMGVACRFLADALMAEVLVACCWSHTASAAMNAKDARVPTRATEPAAASQERAACHPGRDPWWEARTAELDAAGMLPSPVDELLYEGADGGCVGWRVPPFSRCVQGAGRRGRLRCR
jgi:hypothetical protein